MQFQFWDGRAGSLEEQALGPIHNPIEMGETLENVVRKLNAIPGYRSQFQAVFGTDVTDDGIAKAIAAFERTVVIRAVALRSLPRGRDRRRCRQPLNAASTLFNGKGHCTPCHAGRCSPISRSTTSASAWTRTNPDVGREAVTKNPRDRGRFKTPRLRNVALTSPYLHDGSARSLEDVLDLYDRGGGPNATLDPMMRPLRLTDQEKADLKAFMEALTGTMPVIARPALPPDGP